MKKLVVLVLLVAFSVVQPIHAAGMLSKMEYAHNPAQLVERILCPSGVFSAVEAHRFLFRLKQEVREQQGIDLDLNFVVQEAVRVIVGMGKFSQEEISSAQEFYLQLINPETYGFNDEMLSKKNKPTRKNGQPELVLPDKMAVGFACILGGALLCILPSGITQGIGASMIAAGVYSFMDGARDGEKPYYVDSETGSPIGSGIGLGTKF